MTDSQITCFRAVAQFQSFSVAAKHLHISQPAVSSQISKLESSLKLLLVDRTGREIKLTEAGQLFLDYLVRSEQDFKQTIETAMAKQNVFSGSVHLGYPDGWVLDLIYPTFNSFQSEYPNIHLELITIPLGQMEQALLDGSIDAAITMRYTISQSPQITTRPLMSVRNVLLYSRQFPVPSDRPVTLADFKDSIFYLATAENLQPFKDSLMAECSKYGFEPTIVNCSSLNTALLHVQNKQGVLLGSEYMLANRDHTYSSLLLEDVQQQVLLAWKKRSNNGGSSPVNLFLNETLYRVNNSLVK